MLSPNSASNYTKYYLFYTIFFQVYTLQQPDYMRTLRTMSQPCVMVCVINWNLKNYILV